MKKFKKLMANGKKVVAGAGLTVVGFAAQAAPDLTADIASAQTVSEGNVTAAVGAVIAVALLGFGVGAVVGWFRR